MPNSSFKLSKSYQRYCSIVRASSNTRLKNKTKASREFDEFERYYDIGNTECYASRKENFLANDFFFKYKHDAPEQARKNNRSQHEPKSFIGKIPKDFVVTHNVCVKVPLCKSRPVKNVEAELPDQKQVETEPEKIRMDWNDYHRLAVIHSFMDELESDYPSLCTTGSIGKSVEGRDLRILKISNSNASNACVWIDAGIHAREWIAPAVNTYIANHIAKNFDSLPASVRNKDWYFLPVVNPDGYEYSHTTNRMWRKNKACIKHTLFGVDLNRNFSYGWGGKGSSDDPTHNFYRGSKPFSEPESSAIKELFERSGINFKVYITLHSFGQVIIMPFAYSDSLAPDYIRLLEGATAMSKAIFETNGNVYKVGVSKDVMYPASGTSNDWSHGAIGVPYCYLIELRSRKHKFKLPKEEIEETGQEILNCLIALMKLVDNYKAPVLPNAAETNEVTDSTVTVNTEVIKKETEEVPNECKERDLPTKRSEDEKSKPRYESFKVAPGPANAQVWEIKFTKEGQRQFVKSLDTLGAINIWTEGDSTMDIMVELPRIGQVAGILHERGIAFSIAIPDVNQLYENSNTSIVVINNPKCSTNTNMDWYDYHRLDTIYAFMDMLSEEYPYLCSVCVIGQTIEGRDLKMLKISNGDENNMGVWIDGAIHAREWISPAVVTYIADQIVRNFHQYPESITNKDWFILPVLNPDGYEYTHTTDRMWRKNRARIGECIGVDLNRNWSYGWGEKGEEGSSEDPGNIFFRGLRAFSEPETNAVQHTILDSTTKFKVFLSFHSYGDAIIFPWGYTDEPCPDYVSLLEAGTVFAKAIYATSGHTYKVGSTKDLMYYAAGTSIDWSYGVAKIPYSYMVELRGKQHRFLLPKEYIIPTATELLNGVLRLLEFVDGVV